MKSVAAISGESWMRGITPLRLGVLAAVCIMFAGRATLWLFDPQAPFAQMPSF